MATKEELKILFASGKKPTGADFSSLIDGVKGDKGANGTAGVDGFDGDSAYEIAVLVGFVGTEVEWLASLKGETGVAGADGYVTQEMYEALIARLDALETT